jgi:hypothetical protein
MQTIIWVIGSTLIFMVIFSLLPLGYSIQGKILIGLTGFVLAIVGNFVATLYPLGLTVIILAVLVLVGANIIDSRLAAVINLKEETYSYQDDVDEVSENLPEIKRNPDLDTFEFEELEIAATPSLVKINKNTKLSTSLTQNFIAKDGTKDLGEEDISFLQDRSVDELELIEDTVIESGYLSEIENLLLEESEEQKDSGEESWLDELADLSEIEALEELEADEDKPLEELLFLDEVAVSKEVPEKKMVLQK